MTARLQQNELQKKAINERVKKNVSQFSEDLRRRLGEATNFKKEFAAVFDDYCENLLPNEDIMQELQEAAERKKLGLKPEELNVMGNPKVLPTLRTEA